MYNLWIFLFNRVHLQYYTDMDNHFSRDGSNLHWNVFTLSQVDHSNFMFQEGLKLKTIYNINHIVRDNYIITLNHINLNATEPLSSCSFILILLIDITTHAWAVQVPLADEAADQFPWEQCRKVPAIRTRKNHGPHMRQIMSLSKWTKHLKPIAQVYQLIWQQIYNIL